jgi:hypothetical protein
VTGHTLLNVLMKKKKEQDSPEDKLPVELSVSMSAYEKESQEAESKLADAANAKKKKPGRKRAPLR